MGADPSKKLVHIQCTNLVFDHIAAIAARNHSTIPGAVLFILEEWFAANGYAVGHDIQVSKNRIIKESQPGGVAGSLRAGKGPLDLRSQALKSQEADALSSGDLHNKPARRSHK